MTTGRDVKSFAMELLLAHSPLLDVEPFCIRSGVGSRPGHWTGKWLRWTPSGCCSSLYLASLRSQSTSTTGRSISPPGSRPVRPERSPRLVAHHLEKDLTRADVEQVVSRHVKQDVELSAVRFQTRPLQHIRDFWSTRSEFVDS